MQSYACKVRLWFIVGQAFIFNEILFHTRNLNVMGSSSEFTKDWKESTKQSIQKETSTLYSI